MSGKQGTAVSDRMKYNVKPTAVRSECLLNNIKCSNGNTFSPGDQLVFDVPAMSGGYYLDPANSLFRFTVKRGNLVAADGTYVYFGRSPQSLIKRLEIYDAGGHLLENIDNYDALSAMIDICTADYSNATSNALFQKRARDNEDTTKFITNSYGGTMSRQSTAATTSNDYRKYGYLCNDVTTMDIQFCLSSAIFGQATEKYYPLSAMNGFRIQLTLQDATKALTWASDTGATADYNITDPTLFLNVVRVDPEVDRGIVSSSKGPDGKIRIHTQTWRTFSTTISADSTSLDYVIPINVSSLKSLFFTFLSQDIAVNYDYLSFYYRYLTDYQLFVDGNPIPASPVKVTYGFTESYNELMRAWHVRYGDSHGTLLNPVTYEGSDLSNEKSNAVFGLELESFNGKSNVIESGMNVLNSTIQMRMNFSTATSNAHTCMFFCLYDVFLVIDPETGITTLEF